MQITPKEVCLGIIFYGSLNWCEIRLLGMQNNFSACVYITMERLYVDYFMGLLHSCIHRCVYVIV